MSATQDGRYYQRYQVGYGSQHWMELRRNGTNNWRIDENEIRVAVSSPFELWSSIIIYKKQNSSISINHQRNEKAVEIYTRVMGNQVGSGGYFLPIPQQNKWFKQGDDSFLGAYINYASTPDFEYGSDLEMDMAKLHLQMAIRNRSWMHYMVFDENETDWNIYEVEFNEKYWWWLREHAIEFCHSLVNFDYGPPSPSPPFKMYSPFPQLIHSSKDDDPFPSLSGQLIISSSTPPYGDYYYTPTFQP